MDLFILAARKKFRFETSKGLLAVEDLWDMPLVSKDNFNLDTLAIQLDNLADTKSFVKRRSANTNLNINEQKLEIVKFIIDTKVGEIEAAEHAALVRQKKQKLLDALANREDQKVHAMSEDQIRAELAELEKL